ncbi:14401_t:CDS:2 [Funneliformis geosporum]|uniref:alanine--tRNA ligase n=1 Tax=Funneliformis geosporum TaxID=1117311 RepID=A0A9W4SU75_9GLOM|nr:14401_t:CDS:2 [Funneliformis geosporum]
MAEHLTLNQEVGDIFQQKGYYLLEPTSLIPQNDLSLLWINSGVAALKKYFNNPALAPARDLVNCQRVIRTDDLANINAQSYHQTLFEMLDMGDGPCGPNTEIYFDFQDKKELPKNIEELDNKRFIEICNIVFPEFYHHGKEYLPLAQKCVDTGAGLERIAMVDKENPMPLDKVFRCEIEEGQKVSPKTTLFIVYLEEQVISVIVYIP